MLETEPAVRAGRQDAGRQDTGRQNAGRQDAGRQDAGRADPLAKAWIVAVLAMTFLAYLPVLHFQFVYDDIEQIVKNAHIQSWQYLSDYFTQSLWSHGDNFQVRFYRPFFLLWLRLNDALFSVNSSHWHLTTLLSHVCVTFLVYLLVREISGNWVAGILAALLFGLHPVHIQVVAWVSSVSESLLAACLLGSLCCFVKRGDSAGKVSWLSASLLLYASALLLKETAIAFPVIVFAYAVLWPDAIRRRKKVVDDGFGPRAAAAFIRTFPMLLTTAAYLLLRAVVLHTVVTHSAPMKASTLFLTLPWIVLTYLKLLTWPVGLSPMYPSLLVHRAADPHFLWPFAVCAALSVGICLFLRHDKRRQLSEEALAEWKLLVLAGLWAILFMLPALYLPALQEDAFVQDRYLYVPSIGLAIVAGLAITRVGREGAKLLGMPWSQIAIAAACAALMVYGIERELYIWQDNPALFTRAVERSPDNKIARHDLAAALIDAGRYDEGIALLRQLLGDDPNDYVDNNNLAQAYLKKGDRADAETYLTKSCQSHPTPGCLYQLGAMRFNLGRIDVAEQAFSEAIALDPSAQGYHYAEGLALERLGKLAAALEAFQKELALDPDNQQAKIEIGRLTGH